VIDIRDPKRLFESADTPEALRSWLDHAHADRPSSEQIEQLVRTVERLAQSGGAPRLEPLPAAHRSSPPLARSGMSVKALIFLTGIGAAVGLWFVAGRDRPGSAREQSMTGPRPTSALSTTLPSAMPGKEPVAQERPQPSAMVSADTQLGALSASKARAPRAVSLAAPPTPASSNPAPTATNGEEFRLLRAARQRMPADPAGALALTEEHAKRFANGMLGQEREALAIECLRRLGRTAEADARAQRFVLRFPGSPYRSRMEAVPRGSEP
jgi:hypothetical protein